MLLNGKIEGKEVELEIIAYSINFVIISFFLSVLFGLAFASVSSSSLTFFSTSVFICNYPIQWIKRKRKGTGTRDEIRKLKKAEEPEVKLPISTGS